MRLIKAIIGWLFYLVFGFVFIVGLSIVVYLFSIPGMFKAMLTKPTAVNKPRPTVDPELLKYQGGQN